jgi:hypothetical protein
LDLLLNLISRLAAQTGAPAFTGGLFRNCRYGAPFPSHVGGVAVPREAATPDRTVRMARGGPIRTAGWTIGFRMGTTTKLAR